MSVGVLLEVVHACLAPVAEVADAPRGVKKLVDFLPAPQREVVYMRYYQQIIVSIPLSRTAFNSSSC